MTAECIEAWSLDRWAQQFPDKRAVIMSGGETLTYGTLDRRSDALAQRFHAAGLRFGDHIAILMENRIEYPIAVWAAQRSGLIATPINWHLAAAEAAYVINDCEARIVVTSAMQHALIDAIRPLAPKVEQWLDAENLPADTSGSQSTYEPLEGLAMCYSSGTSGRPKGIVMSHPREPYGSSTPAEASLMTVMGFDENIVYLSPAPLYHTAPFMWTKSVLRYGGTIIVMEKFDPDECLQLIERYRPNLAQFVPTMFIRMLKLSEDVRARYDVSSLRRAVHAAAPCPVETKEQMIAWWGPVLFEFYAGTEGGWVQIESEEWLQHKGSVGKTATAHILDDDGNELPANTIGTIYFEPWFRFEYRGDSHKTAESYSPQGWITLGDMGYIDDQGYLFLRDRKSHMIISGGVNIYPQETENALITHPKIADVAVIGVPNTDFGEEVKAVVQLELGETPSPELALEIMAYARERIAHFKCPRSVDFVDALPRLPNGKLLKRELRAQYWTTDV
jgi:acyl-CoA synthetase (AMP-forming)/AMP-acid ligase II